MAKRKEVQQAVDTPTLNDAAFEKLDSDARELTLVKSQHDSAVRAVAQQLGYQLPADCTDPDLIQRDISANMRRSVEACLEVGRGLAVLKTACGHGNFMARLDVLGIDKFVAARFMQSAAKFSKLPTSATLIKAIGTQSKLLEMLVLDDEQIEELALTGQTGELALDDVATMSVKELRAALREMKQEKGATDHLMADKNKKIDQLKAQARRIEKLPPDEQLQQLLQEAAAITRDAMGAVRGGVRQALIAIKNHGTDDNSVIMAGLVGQVQADLNALREEFSLPDVSNASDAQLVAEMSQWADKS
jgi:predicted transposase YbfD/YdcC